MEILIASVLVITGLAALFGFGLAYASKKLAVEKNPLIGQIESALPGANCGACGYAGCAGYAEAIVEEHVDIHLCAPGGSEIMDNIADLTGKKAVASEPMVARVHCGGDDTKTKHKYHYNGVADCVSAAALFHGFLECRDGCLGLGSCVAVCKFDAIKIDQNGSVAIDAEKCTGCGACIKECPHSLIELIPAKKTVYVTCASHEKGAVCNKMCKASCIGCKKCEKECPEEAIVVNDFLAEIDYDKCTSCGRCVEVCPKKCIASLVPIKQVDSGAA